MIRIHGEVLLACAMAIYVGDGARAGDDVDESVPAAVDADRMWYCRELDSGGLRYHYGRWALKSFNVSNQSIQQRGDRLNLERFGMIPQNTHCRHDQQTGIISCTDFFALFNLNLQTGRASMAHALGWANQTSDADPVTNDLSVAALHCRRLEPDSQWSEQPDSVAAADASAAEARDARVSPDP